MVWGTRRKKGSAGDVQSMGTPGESLDNIPRLPQTHHPNRLLKDLISGSNQPGQPGTNSVFSRGQIRGMWWADCKRGTVEGLATQGGQHGLVILTKSQGTAKGTCAGSGKNSGGGGRIFGGTGGFTGLGGGGPAPGEALPPAVYAEPGRPKKAWSSWVGCPSALHFLCGGYRKGRHRGGETPRELGGPAPPAAGGSFFPLFRGGDPADIGGGRDLVGWAGRSLIGEGFPAGAQQSLLRDMGEGAFPVGGFRPTPASEGLPEQIGGRRPGGKSDFRTGGAIRGKTTGFLKRFSGTGNHHRF